MTLEPESTQWSADIDSLCESLSLEELQQSLKDAAILPNEQLSTLFGETASPQQDVKTVVESLLQQSHLHLYQLQQIANGRAEQLRLGEYTVLHPLGRGGMGHVQLALHRRMNRLVAIKFLPEVFGRDREMVQRFEREVQVAAQLSHPHIVAAHDAGVVGDQHFLVMEYVDGCDLSQVVKANGALPLEDAICCVIQAGVGISHAHQKGVIHRDIKPANLLIDREGLVRVLDMGLARWNLDAARSVAADMSSTGMVLGTVDYISPEQASNSKEATTQSDLYSLGCTLFYLVHARAMFEGDSIFEKLVARREQDPPALIDRDETHPLNRIFAKMVDRDPSQRFESVEQACQALQAWLPQDRDLRVSLELLERDLTLTTVTTPETRSVLPEQSFQSTKDLASRPVTKTTQSSYRRIGWMVALLLLAIVVAAGSVVVRLNTPDGTLVVDCQIDGAIVELNGERSAVITDPGTNERYTFELPPGDHLVRVVLPDGTVLRSESVKIERRERTLFEVSRADIGQTPDAEDRPDHTTDDPLVLTVSQQGRAAYQSINAALADYEPGMTIRIMDTSVYSEQLVLNYLHNGLTLEAPNGATLLGGDTPSAYPIVIQAAEEVTIRGFRINTGDAGAGVVAFAQCSGLLLESLEIYKDSPVIEGEVVQSMGMSLEAIDLADEHLPLRVVGCTLRGLGVGIRISGIEDDYISGRPARRIAVLQNDIADCSFALDVTGELTEVLIAGNRIRNSMMTGIQLEQILNDSDRIWIVNNSTYRCQWAFRTWLNEIVDADVRVINNLSVQSGPVDWMALAADNGLIPRGAEDIPSLLSRWTFSHNVREGQSVAATQQFGSAWIPPTTNDVLIETIELQSRNPAEPNFLAPTADDPAATAGIGGELPTYVGALPPPGTEPFDWNAFADSFFASE